jgi:hypothetical protein
LSLSPADAPCRPLEPARLGQLLIQPSTAAGPCDAIFDKKIEDRFSRPPLLLLFLFGGLLFRLSLLRHCCPPSLSGWRHRCSAVANRPALSSDYYSRKKITVTLLNFVCKRASPRRCNMRNADIGEYSTKNFCEDEHALRKFRRAPEMPMERGFLRLICRSFLLRMHACRVVAANIFSARLR